jgi:hypothetical protein
VAALQVEIDLNVIFSLTITWNFLLFHPFSSCIFLRFVSFVLSPQYTLSVEPGRLGRHATLPLKIDFLSKQVFQRVLRAYAGKLVTRLPRGQPGLVTGTEGQVKVLFISIPSYNWHWLSYCSDFLGTRFLH